MPRAYKKPSPAAQHYVLGDRQTMLVDPADGQGRQTIWLRVDQPGAAFGKPLNVGQYHESLQLLVTIRLRSKHEFRAHNGYCISYALLAALEKMGVQTIRVDETDDTVKVYGRFKRAVYNVPLRWWKQHGNAVKDKKYERQVALPRPMMEHHKVSDSSKEQ